VRKAGEVFGIETLGFPEGIYRDEPTSGTTFPEERPFDEVENQSPESVSFDSLAYSKLTYFQSRVR
jgi:hypothetical protein